MGAFRWILGALTIYWRWCDLNNEAIRLAPGFFFNALLHGIALLGAGLRQLTYDNIAQ